jgi:putative salt-induced outer membrane protein YdiY
VGSTQAQNAPTTDGQWRGTLGLGFSHAAGNANSTNFTVKGEAARSTADDKWNLFGEGLRARSEGVTSGNRLRLGTRYDSNLSERVFAFGSLEAERDTVAELDRRTLVGTGLGHKLVNAPDTTFNLIGGLAYTSDRYAAPREIDDDLLTRYSRLNGVLGEESTHKISAATSANQRLVVSPDLRSTGTYRAQWDAGLAVEMTSSMSLTVALGVRYDNDPGVGLERTDSLLTTGIAVKFD